jgi:integrase/recombinase XerD
LRLSELASLCLDQVDNEVIRVIGKGNKERKIFLTPAVKKSINTWLQVRNSGITNTNALFISRRGTQMTTRAIQNVVKKYIIASGLDPNAISTQSSYSSNANVQIWAC